MMIERIDHFVLTVQSRAETCKFYQRVLGFEVQQIEGKPTALTFGRQKINLHEIGHTFEPKARQPTPGSGDFCLIATKPMEEIQERLKEQSVDIEVGPVERFGAEGRMSSIYFRDPDGNLVEISQYI